MNTSTLFVSGGDEANEGLQEYNRPVNSHKIRGDPKSRATRSLLKRIAEALHVRMERVDVDTGEFLRRVAVVPCAAEIARVGGIMLVAEHTRIASKE
jgi:hypothetical protein